MKNCNLKYECLDSQDDYHAQLKKCASEFIPSWDSNDRSGIDIVNELDQQWATSEDAEWECEAQIEIAPSIGSIEKHQQEQVATMDI